MNFIATGIGAGFVSALLTVVVVKATPLAAVLYFLAPLPVLIVSLGWDHRSGIVAALVGGLAIALILSPLSGLGFALITALPAWWLSYLALLGRPGADGAMEWYPVGRLLAWIAVTMALSFVAVVALTVGTDLEAFHQAAQTSARQAIDALEAWSIQNGGAATPDGELHASAQRMANLLPFIASAFYTFCYVIYLYVAARIVSASGRLARPWPHVSGFVIPLGAGLFSIALLGLMAVLTSADFLGFLTYSLAGALFMGFGLQGLAAIHDRTQGKAGRPFILSTLYVLVFVTQGYLMIALALFGLADTVFGLRRRFGARRNQPPTLST